MEFEVAARESLLVCRSAAARWEKDPGRNSERGSVRVRRRFIVVLGMATLSHTHGLLTVDS
jgi:hypothetical protein